MTTVYSFPSLSRPDAELIILGSMPGKASLHANQYYAHPRNAFWLLMESLFGIDRCLAYEDRCMQLLEHKVAVWDVLKMCTRQSSLDSDIVESTIISNDFVGFLSAHTQIDKIYFNGAKAEKSFIRYVVPSLPEAQAAIRRIRLPSTSPAHASLNFEQKHSLWKQLKDD